MKIILGIIFSVLIISMILPASALQQSASKLTYDLQLGSTQTIYWKLISDSEHDSILKISTLGAGKELVSIPAEIELPAKKSVKIPVTVTIPEDYKNNIILKPQISAVQEAALDTGAVVFNIAMAKILEINIGDNPVLKEEEKPTPKITPKSEVVEDITPPKESQPESSFTIKPNEAKAVDTKSTEMIPEPIPEPTSEPQCGPGTEPVDGYCKLITTNDDGGCLIATAAYGTELAPQVQFLREIRDNTVLSTESGTAFMTGFNTLYYSFAPTIADWERENPMFQESVRVFITPMISTLSIMSLADNGSEASVFGLGISVIALNLAMYIAMPLTAIVLIRRTVYQKIHLH